MCTCRFNKKGWNELHEKEDNIKAGVETEGFKKDAEFFRKLYTEDTLHDILTINHSHVSKLKEKGKFTFLQQVDTTFP